jgi:general secretion pathway protein B
LPTVWELPYAARKDIPAIELSMHVFSSDPKQRFVVIKGDRHVEGDEVASDLVLREIRQDGLVLEYKGQKFFFPRNGR